MGDVFFVSAAYPNILLKSEYAPYYSLLMDDLKCPACKTDKHIVMINECCNALGEICGCDKRGRQFHFCDVRKKIVVHILKKGEEPYCEECVVAQVDFMKKQIASGIDRLPRNEVDCSAGRNPTVGEKELYVRLTSLTETILPDACLD